MNFQRSRLNLTAPRQLAYKLTVTLATKITKTAKELGGRGKAPYLFKFFVFFVAMRTNH